MTEPLNDQLSAFLDGELPRAESELFVRRLPRDAELRAAASRFYLIGQAIRAEQSAVRRDFAARVVAAVVQEGPVTGVVAGVTAMARNLPRSRLAEWWKPAAGVAVAAGVAMVAILVVQNQQGARVLPVLTPTPEVAKIGPAKPGSQFTRPGGSNEPAIYVVPPKGDSPLAPLNAARLASYVFAHSDYSSLPGRRNVVSEAAVQDDSAKSAAAEAPAP
jgi:sigma-E factor negative regulatory protein RseA